MTDWDDPLADAEVIYDRNEEGWAALLQVPRLAYVGYVGPGARRAKSYQVLLASESNPDFESIVLDRFEEWHWQLDAGEVAAGPVDRVVRTRIRDEPHTRYAAVRSWVLEESLLA